MSETETERMRAWIRTAQLIDWSNLDEDILNGINTSWSIGAAHTATEILAAIRLVGPTPPGQISWPLLAGGVYAALLDVAGVPYDETEWIAWEAQMCKYGTVAECKAAYAGSVAAIRRDTEELRECAAEYETDYVEGN